MPSTFTSTSIDHKKSVKPKRKLYGKEYWNLNDPKVDKSLKELLLSLKKDEYIFPKWLFTGIDKDNYFCQIKNLRKRRHLFFAYFIFDCIRQKIPKFQKANQISKDDFITYWTSLGFKFCHTVFRNAMSINDEDVSKDLCRLVSNYKRTYLKLYPRDFSTQFVKITWDLLYPITNLKCYISFSMMIYACSPLYSFTDKEKSKYEQSYDYRDRVLWWVNGTSLKPTIARYQCSYWYAWGVLQPDVSDRLLLWIFLLQRLGYSCNCIHTFKWHWNNTIIRWWNIYTSNAFVYLTNIRFWKWLKKRKEDYKYDLKDKGFKIINFSWMFKKTITKKTAVVGVRTIYDQLSEVLRNYRSSTYSLYIMFSSFCDSINNDESLTEGKKKSLIFKELINFKEKLFRERNTYDHEKLRIHDTVERFSIIWWLT